MVCTGRKAVSAHFRYKTHLEYTGAGLTESIVQFRCTNVEITHIKRPAHSGLWHSHEGCKYPISHFMQLLEDLCQNRGNFGHVDILIMLVLICLTYFRAFRHE